MNSIPMLLLFVSCCCATIAPHSTHLSINLRGDRGLVAISTPDRTLSGASKPTLMQWRACDIIEGADCQERWNALIRSHLQLRSAPRPRASDDVIIDVLGTALTHVQRRLFETYGQVVSEIRVTLVSPATCDPSCRNRWRDALSRTGNMRLHRLCRETSALWQLMLSGQERQSTLLIVDEFSGANVLERESAEYWYWSFGGEFHSSALVWGDAIDALALRPPNDAAYAAGALVGRGTIALDHCPAFH